MNNLVPCAAIKDLYAVPISVPLPAVKVKPFPENVEFVIIVTYEHDHDDKSGFLH